MERYPTDREAGRRLPVPTIRIWTPVPTSPIDGIVCCGSANSFTKARVASQRLANIRRVSELKDKDFGAGNRMATTSRATTCGSSAPALPEVADYLLWYAKDKPRFLVRQDFILDIEPFTGRSRWNRALQQ